MPEDRYAFTASERDEFLRLAAKLRNLDQSGSILSEEIHTTAAPEVYIAEISAAGIPPLGINIGTSSGSGSGLLELPNYADCQIYRLVFNQFSEQYLISPVTGFNRQVFNFTPSWLFKGYAIIAREKYGSWVVTAPWITRQRAKTTSTIASKSSGIVNIWNNGVVTNPLWRVTAWLNWMNGTSTIAANKEVVIQHYAQDLNADGRLGKWIIEEREC